ncbi:MAG: hypothetical protein VCF07_03115 [Nitrospinota bacterium]
MCLEDPGQRLLDGDFRPGHRPGAIRQEPRLDQLHRHRPHDTPASPEPGPPPAELSLWKGKTWVDIYRALDENLGSFIPFKNIYTSEGTEKIETPAGKFITVRIKWLRKNVATGEIVEDVTWYSPRVKNIVKVWSAWPRGTKMILTGYRLKKRGSRGKRIGP